MTRTKYKKSLCESGKTMRKLITKFSLYYKLTSLWESGELKSATLIGMFRCCVLQEGIRGPLTGVKPVPPPMRDSKLNIIPCEGVVMEIPGISWFFDAMVAATLRLLGLGGFGCITTAWLNIIWKRKLLYEKIWYSKKYFEKMLCDKLLTHVSQCFQFTFFVGEGNKNISLFIGSMTSVLTLSSVLS